MVGLSGGVHFRTRQAVERYLDALPCPVYIVGVGYHSGGQMQRRQWDKETVLKSLGWLARENARGKDIYIRPHEPRFVLVDDLTSEQVEQLKMLGLEPSAVLETSPGNHQAWIDLGQVVTPQEASRAAAVIARQIGGDLGSASYDHFGRMPGMTNRKSKHTQSNGFQPFVMVKEAAHRVASRADDLLQRVRDFLAEKSHQVLHQVQRRAAPERPIQHAYKIEWESLIARAQGDMSRADFMASQRLLIAGYDPEDVENVVAECSPRKSDPLAYARRTVAAAQASDLVAVAQDDQDQDDRPR